MNNAVLLRMQKLTNTVVKWFLNCEKWQELSQKVKLRLRKLTTFVDILVFSGNNEQKNLTKLYYLLDNWQNLLFMLI